MKNIISSLLLFFALCVMVHGNQVKNIGKLRAKMPTCKEGLIKPEVNKIIKLGILSLLLNSKPSVNDSLQNIGPQKKWRGNFVKRPTQLQGPRSIVFFAVAVDTLNEPKSPFGLIINDTTTDHISLAALASLPIPHTNATTYCKSRNGQLLVITVDKTGKGKADMVYAFMVPQSKQACFKKVPPFVEGENVYIPLISKKSCI